MTLEVIMIKVESFYCFDDYDRLTA